MILRIVVVILLMAAFSVFLFAITFDFKLKKMKTSPYKSSQCSYFVGTWRYYDHKRKRFYYFTVTDDYDVTLNGKPLNVTITLLSPSVFIFKDPYGFNMRLHYYSSDSFSLYDEANECHYVLTKLSKEENVNELVR